ncbi:hypothetical protein PVAND_014664 [Polypedilum vanderplanki]|uniref:Uncharacterized protein n=1 Tax=Polypedilum vanderplanki TaxID=319348 RepID=A0A9J6BAN8_POLVA|nr:hypothetical protein PVAND_014664 [Polypedilum vanderplanki]
MSSSNRIHFPILVFVVSTLFHLHFTSAIELNFDIQTSDNTVDDTNKKEENQAAEQSICKNVWCINDAHYLFSVSSQFGSVNPCDDLEVVDDIKEIENQLFQSIVNEIYHERLRKILATKYDEVKDHGSRVMRVMKNTFRQCFNSLHPTKHLQAQHDIFQHLKGLGSSPLLDNFLNLTDDDEKWNNETFNFNLYFEVEPNHAMKIFFDLEVGRCGENICLKKPNNSWNIFDEEFEAEKLLEIFENGSEFYDEMKSALQRKNFYHIYREFIKSEVKNSDSTFVKIKDLAEKFPLQFNVDWLQIINGELLERSQLTENDEILIESGVEVMQNLVYFMLVERSVIADTFALTFLNEHYDDLILNLDSNDLSPSNLHFINRWSNCISRIHQTFMNPALVFMYEQWRSVWDRNINEIGEQVDIIASAEELIFEAVDTFVAWFSQKKNEEVAELIRADVISKLKTIDIAVSLQQKTMTFEKLEEFYEELFLEGDENFMRSIWEMKRFHRKILNEPKESWRSIIEEMVGNDEMKYNVEDENVLYVPPAMLIYPWYHPLRSRFFNMATIFTEVISKISSGVKKHVEILSNDLSFNSFYQHPESVQLSYENYKRWLQNNTETQIAATNAKNLQLYWLAHAAAKYQKSDNDEHLIRDYFAKCKRYEGFKDAFLCGENEENKNVNLGV